MAKQPTHVKIANTVLFIALFVLVQDEQAQSFVNLNFESANFSGYSPGDAVPIADALPGWSAYLSYSGGTNTLSTIPYDAFSGGGALITVVDTNTATAGTETLLFNAYASSATFIVTLDGQTITMTPLEIFSNYTLYGGNISSFANCTETLSFTEPPAPVGQAGGDPNIFELDNIQFSSSPVPEPSALGLSALGGLFLAWRRWKAWAI